jgi:hypothetical protein
MIVSNSIKQCVLKVLERGGKYISYFIFVLREKQILKKQRNGALVSLHDSSSFICICQGSSEEGGRIINSRPYSESSGFQRLATGWTTEGSEFRVPVGTGSEVHPTSYPMGIGGAFLEG